MAPWQSRFQPLGGGSKEGIEIQNCLNAGKIVLILAELHKFLHNCVNFCVFVSKMTAMVAILKFFKHHLSNCKSDWANTGWKTSGEHGNLESLNSYDPILAHLSRRLIGELIVCQ